MPPLRKPTPPHVPDFRSIAREVRRVANVATFDACVDYADDERDKFVRRIEEQAFPRFQEILYPESGTNLSPDWLERKERKQRDLRTMIATGWYRDNIKRFTRKSRRKGEPTQIKVGFDARTRARDLDGRITDVPLWLVATYNEFGSLDGNLPARPHWRVHLENMRSKASRTRRAVREAVKDALRSESSLKGKIVVK